MMELEILNGTITIELKEAVRSLTFQVMELPNYVWIVLQKQGHGGEMRLREILK